MVSGECRRDEAWVDIRIHQQSVLFEQTHGYCVTINGRLLLRKIWLRR